MSKRLPHPAIAGAALLVAVLFAVAPASSPAAEQFAVGLGIDYASGDYGTDTTTRSVRVPLTVDYFPTERLDFELIVPYLYQNNANTVFAGGLRFPFQRRQGRHQAGVDSSSSERGLGDISLTAGYILQPETAVLPSIRSLLYLKFPTADEDQGLGTGEYDFGAGLGVARWFGPWYAFGEARYIFQGSNADLGLKDYATLELEGGYLVTGRFLPTLSLWGSTAPADDASKIVEARLSGTCWVNRAVYLKGYLGRGLSDQAADYGAGLSVFYLF